MPSKLLIEDFAENVLIIDDNHDEVVGLEKQLELSDISFESFTPTELERKNFRKVRQLIFLDLKLDEFRSESAEYISRVRKILKTLFPVKIQGTYGIVLWTKHTEYLEQFLRAIARDRQNNSYNTPLFIIDMNKNEYIENGYEKCLADLDAKIRADKTTLFFVRWMVAARRAAEKSISDIYALVPEYAKQNTELLYLLQCLALNHTGMDLGIVPKDYNLSLDAYKVFDELLYTDLIAQLDDAWGDILTPRPMNPWSKNPQHANEVFSKINRKFFLDNTHIDPAIIVPGNVYRVVGEGRMCKQNKVIPDNSVEIALEITPPCDFSQKNKIHSRIVRGAICNTTAKNVFSKGYYYNYINHIEIDGQTNMQIVLDFRYIELVPDKDLQDEAKFKLMFRVTPRLFADILQKCSSHMARLGVAEIHA